MTTAFDLPGFSPDLVRELSTAFVQGEGSTFQNEPAEIALQTAFLIARLRETQPRHVLETGTHKAHFVYLARLAAPGCTVDTFGLEPESQECVNRLNEQLGVYAAFRVGDSKRTLAAFEPAYPIDFAWVDGGHDRETCLADLENCARLDVPEICVDDYWGEVGVREAVADFVRAGGYSVVETTTDRRGICHLRRTSAP